MELVCEVCLELVVGGEGGFLGCDLLLVGCCLLFVGDYFLSHAKYLTLKGGKVIRDHVFFSLKSINLFL